MPSSLPYKKVYINSKFRTPDSNSSSDFKIELPETMSFKEDTCFYIDDICLPHSWPSIISNINNKLYFKIFKINVLPELEYNLIATIDQANYTGGDLATEMTTEMNGHAQTATGVANLFTCTYDVMTNKMRIVINNNLYAFRIVTQPELKTIDWSGPAFDRKKPNDINEVLSNLGNYSLRYNTVIPYVSGPINLQPFNCIYIHANNLGNYNSIGPQNERTIVKSVKVTADTNHVIFDECVLINDYSDCSGQTIKTLYFQLKSADGDIVPLENCNWSFSIVFSRANPDI